MEVLSIKKCTKCGTEKELSSINFPPHNKTKSGFDSWCRKCRGNYRSEIRRGSFRSMISDEHLKYIINTVEECVICGHIGVLNVDHCHKKNVIRGMLCSSCNIGLGNFKDDPELLEFARMYLLSYSENEGDIEEYNNYIIKNRQTINVK